LLHRVRDGAGLGIWRIVKDQRNEPRERKS
jgi:hypothetical protein